MKKILSILFVLTAVLPTIAQVDVESSIDSVSILIGEEAHMTINVIANKNSKIQFPSFKPSLQITKGVEVLSVNNGDTTLLDNNKMKVSKIFTLTSFDEHLYAIPAIKVKVDNKTYSTRTLALKVLTVDVDTLHSDKFFPPKDVQNNPFSWEEWSSPFWLSVLLLAFCCIGYYLLTRLRENKPIITRIKIVKKIPSHQKAFVNINKLKNNRSLLESDQKAYYTQLTDTLRLYMKERFGFNAMEMTTDQIIDNLKSAGNQETIDELKELFETADLVKFAKYSALINENDLNLVNAINFIDQTKIEGQATEERIVPKLSDDEIKSRHNAIAIKALLFVLTVFVIALFVYIAYSVSQLLSY